MMNPDAVTKPPVVATSAKMVTTATVVAKVASWLYGHNHLGEKVQMLFRFLAWTWAWYSPWWIGRRCISRLLW
jgi:hypothetical protein